MVGLQLLVFICGDIVRNVKLLLLVVLTIGIAGCSAKPKGPLKAGFQTDGSYLTSAQERKMSCNDLTNLAIVGAGELGGLQSQANVSTGLGIAMAVISIAATGGAAIATTDFGRDARARRDKQRNRLTEYNKILSSKGCQPVDLDAEIEKAAAQADAQKKKS